MAKYLFYLLPLSILFCAFYFSGSNMYKGFGLYKSGEKAKAVCVDVVVESVCDQDYSNDDSGVFYENCYDVHYPIVDFEYEGECYRAMLDVVNISLGFMSSRNIIKGDVIDVVFSRDDPEGTVVQDKVWVMIIWPLVGFLFLLLVGLWVLKGVFVYVGEF